MQKTVLITGGNSGIGKATAKQLAQQSWNVIIAARSSDKAQQAIQDIKKDVPNAAITHLQVDLSNLDSVRQLADKVKSQYASLDVLINNAGGLWKERSETPIGIEYSFAANHLGHFLLTNLLLEPLRNAKAARIINVSSEMHRLAKFDIDQYVRGNTYNSWKNYGFNKLCNVLFTYQLARQLKNTSITVNALHPGVIASNFGQDIGWMRFVSPLFKLLFASTDKGSRPSVSLATRIDPPNSSYFKEMKLVQSSPESYNEAHQNSLWEYSAQLCRL